MTFNGESKMRIYIDNLGLIDIIMVENMQKLPKNAKYECFADKIDRPIYMDNEYNFYAVYK